MTDENNVLFVRGSGNKSEDEDMWDDTALIQAYDKAVNLAKEEVAKRIAMDAQSRQTKQKFQNFKHPNQTKKPFKKWTVGAPCRAVYSEDGEVYEAIISKIYENSGTCIVQFIGYQNTEKVELSSLLESEGLQSQIAQRKQALIQNANEEDADSEASTCFPQSNFKQTNGMMDYETSDKRSRFFKNSSIPVSEINPPICAMPPPPPLPPQLMAKLPETDTDALSSMLMSWYISGFHTGYYHGLKQAKINQEKRRNCQ